MCSCDNTNACSAHRGLRSRFFAWAWSHVGRSIEKGYHAHKAALFGGVPAELVEIGPGAGINFQHYPPGTLVHAVEPNVYMHAYLREAAARAGVRIECREGHAEALPYPDASVEAVVSTLVLCSVDNPAAALREVVRVLKPGGRFIFIEHVIAPEGTLLRRAQHLFAPLWRHIGDGCNPDRDTAAVLHAAGFSRVELEPRYITNSFVLVWPHILGHAVK
jgi:ubiquinone/menaquinone biosynthesis C-methylase UbiE